GVFTALLDTVDITAHSVGQRNFLCTGRRFIVTFPKRKDERFDAFPFLDVENAIVRVERIKGNGDILGIGKVNTVLAFGLTLNQLAHSLIGITCVHGQDVCALCVVLAQLVVGEKR